MYLNEKKKLPAGFITMHLLKKYTIGISATLLNKKFFKIINLILNIILLEILIFFKIKFERKI